tara:strand:- start:326 stop:961 length:636 start_codon:yes stop_codon:yes gene_type:complete
MVYLVAADDKSLCKIGSTADIDQRIKSLRVESGLKLHLVRLIYPHGGNGETTLHKKFKHHRVKGEWFVYCDEIIDYFNNLPDIYNEWKEHNADPKNKKNGTTYRGKGSKSCPNPFKGVSVAGKAFTLYHSEDLYQMSDVEKNLLFFILGNMKDGWVDIHFDYVFSEVKKVEGAKYSYDPHYKAVKRLVEKGYIKKRHRSSYWINPVKIKLK